MAAKKIDKSKFKVFLSRQDTTDALLIFNTYEEALADAKDSAEEVEEDATVYGLVELASVEYVPAQMDVKEY